MVFLCHAIWYKFHEKVFPSSKQNWVLGTSGTKKVTTKKVIPYKTWLHINQLLYHHSLSNRSCNISNVKESKPSVPRNIWKLKHPTNSKVFYLLHSVHQWSQCPCTRMPVRYPLICKLHYFDKGFGARKYWWSSIGHPVIIFSKTYF